MDCIQESAAISLLRIEVLVIQGILRAVMLYLIGVVTFPIAMFGIIVSRWRLSEISFVKKAIRLPSWVFLGLLISAVSPFMAFCRCILDTKVIVGAEWKERWRYGVMKNPDGSPMSNEQ